MRQLEHFICKCWDQTKNKQALVAKKNGGRSSNRLFGLPDRAVVSSSAGAEVSCTM